MDNNDSFNYDQFLVENTDNYHTTTCVELKNRTTGRYMNDANISKVQTESLRTMITVVETAKAIMYIVDGRKLTFGRHSITAAYS
jgi:hypothetical protein